jgi:UDP-N-acetylglucosamine diphosphorylase/glucosamine-1-phosphate N-acetyltransferase
VSVKEVAMKRYSHPEVAALVLAAGQGTRMKSDLAKVLHLMAGQPLLAYVLQTLDHLGVGRRLVVIGHQRDRVRAAFSEAEVEWVVQEPQRGTGHAVQMAGPALEDFHGTLLVVCGDTPLLGAATLDRLLAAHQASGAAVTVLSMRLADPTGYGRILREGPGVPGVLGRIIGIVEHRDAAAEQRAIDEVNSGIYAFSYPRLETVLSRLGAHNAQGEFYLTDTVALLRAGGEEAAVLCAPDSRELLGINTVEQLGDAERAWRQLAAAGGEP